MLWLLLSSAGRKPEFRAIPAPGLWPRPNIAPSTSFALTRNARERELLLARAQSCAGDFSSAQQD